jgi:hypothetical protein
LMSGHFEYPLPEWQPEVRYHLEGPEGLLRVKQPDQQGSSAARGQHLWDLAFGDDVPLELQLQLGAGDAKVRLANTLLTKLDGAIGSGNLEADLSGGLRDLESIALKVGSGRLGVTLSGEYPKLARIDVANASGVSDLQLHGSCPTLSQVKVSGASGRVAVSIEGDFPELETLAVSTASGVIVLDLPKRLSQDLSVTINCVAGSATVTCPPDVGVIARLRSLTGRIEAPGFHRVDSGYANDAYEEATVRASLVMSTVSGKLILQPTD